MKQEVFNKYIKLISSKDLQELQYCFHSLLKSCNIILNEPIRLKIRFDERKHDSSLMIQKTMLHGFSIEKLFEGINIKFPQNDIAAVIYDPLSMVVLCRSLLESYLTFNHLNLASNELERIVRFKIWIQYGLRQRIKIERNIAIEKEELKEIFKNDNKSIIDLTEEIKKSELYENLSEEKKITLLKTIKTEWKISFNGNSFITLGWQDLLKNTGMNPILLAEAYNFLSWYAHTTSISIYQLRDIHKNGFIELLTANTLKYSSFFLSMAIAEIIKFDQCYQNAYNKIDQELKDWINVYNYFVRDDTYTIEKIE